ncbi:MAG: hypothetical protein EAY70_02450 [Sphingomonadales bacterium]|nr:MAG: hypothetical protein EAY70_02450 [Sphingomonadales bacterium]
MSAHAFDRWRLTLPLLLPALGGVAYLAAFDAAARLIAIHSGALLLALAWVLWGRLPSTPHVRFGIAAVAALSLFLPLLTGPEVGGVSRWFPAGPVMLHSGALLLPLIVVLVAGAERFGPPVLALATAALALQPDAAGLAGLAAAGAALTATRRSTSFALIAAAAGALAALTFGRGTLEPQVFTEEVLAQVWQSAPIAALALAGLLFFASPWLILRAPDFPRTQGLALAASLVALGLMACLAPFPFPLIGYGASPILGFALALSAAGKPVHM